MKKTILAVAALVAVGMTSCNNDEELLQGNEAIGFSNVFVDNSTRSFSDPSYTNNNLFEDFAVYGFVEGAVLFNGNTVSKTITNNALDWKYEGTQYWIAGAKYNFAAIAPMTDGGWTNESCTLVDNNVKTTLSFTNNDGTTDLLYSNPATIQGMVSGNEAVPFTFRHLLSKVKFSFKNNYNASNATIKVSNIKINNAYKTGTVTLIGADSIAWTKQTSSLELDFGAATDDESTDNKEGAAVAFGFGKTYESLNERLLIPSQRADGENAGYKVTFTVDLLIGGTLVKQYSHTAYVNHEFVAGHSYDIVAEINAENIDPEKKQEPIEFTVEPISGWGEPNNQNM